MFGSIWIAVRFYMGNKIISISKGNIVNWTLGNKLQRNLNQNLNIFTEENAFENVVWKMAAILSRPQCVHVALTCFVCRHFVLSMFWLSTFWSLIGTNSLYHRIYWLLLFHQVSLCTCRGFDYIWFNENKSFYLLLWFHYDPINTLWIHLGFWLSFVYVFGSV